MSTAVNLQAIRAIYMFEMSRTGRTLLQSIVSPVISTSLYFVVFGAALGLIALAYFYTQISHTLLFWTAFILTRPLGATLGDILTKPASTGGLNLNRISSSLIIAACIVVAILLTSQRSREPSAA